jgi:DNA-binding NtrC family response regulator
MPPDLPPPHLLLALQGAATPAVAALLEAEGVRVSCAAGLATFLEALRQGAPGAVAGTGPHTGPGSGEYTGRDAGRNAGAGTGIRAGPGPHPWAAAVLQVEEIDPPFLARITEALSGGILVLVAPDTGVEAVVQAEAAGAAALLPASPDPAALARTLAHFLAPYLAEGPDIPVPPPGSVRDDAVVGDSPPMREAWRTVARVAPTRATVLVLGASGTGKELVARALHLHSPRAKGPFVTVNCAAIPGGLLEAELFGYERGAFTGAVGRSDGRFGRADGGTLFLDEVGEMEPPLQAKLLRVLETGEVDRLGGGPSVQVDVRIVAATNRDLEARVRDGAFREDLLYRLAVVTIPLPPLRSRPGDLRPLAVHFASLFAGRHGRPIRAFSAQAMAALEARPWPGNVRELRNVLDRAVLLARGGVLRTVDLAPSNASPHLAPPDDGLDPAYPVDMTLREVEERHLRRVLTHTGGHLGEAARILGVHRNTVGSKLRTYGIDPADPAMLPSDRASGG